MNIDAERDRLLALAEKATPGPWELWTSCSFRRFGSHEGMVCEPVTQNDGHPDLYFRNGGNDGPDARLIAAVPDMIALIRAQAAEIERLRGVCATTYQAAGVSDWPEPWLDILSDAANGDPLRHDPMALLPFEATSDRDSVIEECAKVCDARFTGDLNREDREARRCAAAIRALKG